MKTLPTHTLVLLVALAVSAQLVIGCRKVGHLLPPATYDTSRVPDSWVAFSERDGTYYLLELNPDGEGRMLSQRIHGDTELIKVVKWNLSGYQLHVLLDSTNSNRITSLVCFTGPNSLGANMHGSTGWKEHLVFWRLGVHERRLQELVNFGIGIGVKP